MLILLFTMLLTHLVGCAVSVETGSVLYGVLAGGTLGTIFLAAVLKGASR